MQDFRNLVVWKDAHEFVLSIYSLCSHFPSDERFGLTSQIKRAAVSVVANIAEGSQRNSDADFARFISMASGSIGELHALLLLAEDLDYVPKGERERLEQRISVIRRRLIAFRKILKK